MKQNEFFDLAHEMEKECGDWENSEGMSKEARDALMKKAEQRLAQKEADKGDGAKTGKKVTCFRPKKRYLVVLAAALVLAMGTGVVGDRAWIAESDDMERETEVTTKVDNDEKGNVLREEEEIYQEIADKLGIVPMRMLYIPKGMVLDSYAITEETGWVGIYYLYDDKVIAVEMFKKSIESSTNVQWDGDAYELKDISNIHGYEENIEAYCIDEENRNYGANITYGNGYYSITGSMEKEVFLQILEGIYFKNM